jgi:hypothetical protein
VPSQGGFAGGGVGAEVRAKVAGHAAPAGDSAHAALDGFRVRVVAAAEAAFQAPEVFAGPDEFLGPGHLGGAGSGGGPHENSAQRQGRSGLLMVWLTRFFMPPR